MRKIYLIAGALFALFGFAANAIAEGERVVDMWHCTVNDGKTMDDVRAANAKWSKYMNANIDGGDINSYILTPMVGKRGGFMYVDSFPSLASWSAADALDSEEMTAINEELDAVADCKMNSLHKSEKS